MHIYLAYYFSKCAINILYSLVEVRGREMLRRSCRGELAGFEPKR